MVIRYVVKGSMKAMQLVGFRSLGKTRSKDNGIAFNMHYVKKLTPSKLECAMLGLSFVGRLVSFVKSFQRMDNLWRLCR